MDEPDVDNMTPEQIAQMQRDNCIFCKIISGDIPSKKVYEDSDFIGILDINPAANGHVLLLPKKHYQILPQLPHELVGSLGIACSNISSKILQAFDCDGTNIFIANGAVAGQKSPHFMAHIIPRKDGDNISLSPELKEIDDKSYESIREKISSAMRIRPQPQMASRVQPQVVKRQEREEETEDLESEDANRESNNESEEEAPDEIYVDEELEEKNTKSRKEKLSKNEEDEELEENEGSEQEDEEPKKQNSSNTIDYDKLAKMFGSGR